MSLYNGPPRGGARGGKDQFNWENVKSDKDREFYLGHSVKASVGRWQKGKDLFWYAKDKKDDAEAAVRSELATVKAREEELMLEALGMKPKKVIPKTQPQLDQLDMKRLMEKGADEEEDDRTEADQIKGIGYHGGQITGAGDAEREVMAGVGMGRAAPRGSQAGPSSAAANLPPPPKLSEKDLRKLQKAQKKELRKAKKAAKKAKKEAKKEAKKLKNAEKRKRHDSNSDSSSDSDTSESPPRHKRPRVDSGELQRIGGNEHRGRGSDARETKALADGKRAQSSPERQRLERPRRSYERSDLQQYRQHERRDSPRRHQRESAAGRDDGRRQHRSPDEGRRRARYDSRSPPRRR